MAQRIFVYNRYKGHKLRAEPDDAAMDPICMLKLNKLNSALGNPEPYPYLRESGTSNADKARFDFQEPSTCALILAAAH